MRTAVVILNWNTEGLLKAFLPGLLASCPHDAEVIVADNGSTDGSLKMLAADFPSVRTIPLGFNHGFTGGYNRALEAIDAEYFVLINSDIDITPGWLEPLIEWMDSHPSCGVCGPKLHALLTGPGGEYVRTSRFEYAGAAGGYVDRYGFPFCRGRILAEVEEDTGQYDTPQDVLWVSGACLVTRSSLWRELGGLDDRFFAHMEEIDYCWRAWRKGYAVTVIPQSCVWHLGGGTLSPDSPFKLELNFRNNLLLLENNLPATIGMCRARMRIAFRKLLDCGAAFVYLLRGRMDCVRAVVNAHKGYRERRIRPLARPASVVPVEGYRNVCILLRKKI